MFVLVGCLLASFFYGMRLDLPGLAAVDGILFLVTVTPTFMASAFVADLTLERPVYSRELADGLYRPRSYACAKALASVPGLAASALAFAGVLYPSVGLRPSPPRFLFFALVCFANLCTAMLVGYTLASALPGDVAPLVLLPSFATLHTLCTGFLISRSALPALWRWLYTISYEQWLWRALMLNQHRGAAYSAYCDGGSTADALVALLPASVSPAARAELRVATNFLAGSDGCVPLQGDDVLLAFGLHGGTQWAALGWAALWVPALAALFYAGVRCVRHDRR